MPAKKRKITDSFKQKKNVNDGGVKKVDNVKPSTSTAEFEEDMKILKEFDLNWEYGPSMGITRMERWKRAEKHGLNPSDLVKQTVEAHEDDERYTECLWNDYKNIV